MRSNFVSGLRPSLAAFGIALFLNGAPAALPASADPSPVKIAIFNFELDDASAGAAILDDQARDIEQLDRARNDVRELIAKSGRYSIVDVSSAEGDAVKKRALWKCDGCEAAIAAKLGADQSFIGVVTRISRTEYAVRFKIRDAHSGAMVQALQTDLRMGANYSWNRGAIWLVKNRLFDTP